MEDVGSCNLSKQYDQYTIGNNPSLPQRSTGYIFRIYTKLLFYLQGGY